MKITGIEIGEHRQFKNIKFDFTYPEGHPKAGQPLEKVCFIGQSGTGKTTLLTVIEAVTRDVINGFNNATGELEKAENSTSLEKDNIVFSFAYGSRAVNYSTQSMFRISDVGMWIKSNDLVDVIKQTNKLLLSLKDSIAQTSSQLLNKQSIKKSSEKSLIKTDKELEEEREKTKEEIETVHNAKGVVIGSTTQQIVWKYLLEDINNYDTESKNIALKLVQEVSVFSTDKLIKELTAWKHENPNPRLHLAENCLNPLLKNFHLEVDLENTEVPIVIRTRKGIRIPNLSLSTGTKQIITTAIPLYKFNTIDSVVLFDEPERSLFPDIQRILIKYYTSLAPEAQFFFATHSPIIASAFEPCERFVLYFDENGEVNFHKGVAPIGDDPNDVLRKDFGMSPLVPDEGVDAYQKYLDLVPEIRNESNLNRRMELIAERAKLGNDYDFPVTSSDATN